MPQKYKVFFNHNKLFISKEQIGNIFFKSTYINPDITTLKELIAYLMNNIEEGNYLIITSNPKQFWKLFKSFFEVRKAGGGLVLNGNKHRLYIERKGFWDLPKGHLENGESYRKAALREVEEECGVDNLKIIRKLAKTYHTYELKNKIILKPTKWYLMECKQCKKPVPQTKEGITQAIWANETLEAELIKNIYPSIMDVLVAANAAAPAADSASV